MAPVTTELKVLIKAIGESELKKLEGSLLKLGKQANQSDVSLKKVALDLKKVQNAAGPQSINSLRQYRNAWKAISEEVAVGSREFKVATKNAQRLQAQLDKAQGRGKAGGRFGGLRGGAQVAGTIAGAGIFGGPEGALGAGIGALAGGPAGAVIGAGIGAQVGQVRQALGAVAEYGAELNKLRIALQGVTNGQLEYDRALASIQQATQDFAIPQALVTEQFTKLQASVSGAGGNIGDTETAFRGIVAAVRATGGSLADVDAALTATAQVFSKGKVSAEELRQQIGERLPGAFTLFAESIGKTPAELDKALEDGEVTLQDFLTFARAIFKKYGETAQIIADAPESAGDRLAVSLEQLNEKVAPELTRLGAQFQNFANEAAGALLRLFEDLDRLGRELEEKVNGPELQRLEKARGSAQRALIRTDLTPEQRKLQESFLRSAEKRIAELTFIGPPTPTVAQKGFGAPLPKKPPKTAQARAARARKEVVDYTEQEFYLRQRINDALEKEQLYVQAIAEFDLKIFQINRDLVQQPLKQLDEFRKAEIKLNQEILKIDEQRVSEAEKLENGIETFNKMLADMVPETKKLEELFKSVGDAITTGIAGAIESAIFEAKSLQESLSGILRSVASIFIQFGTKSLLGGLFPNAYGNVFEENKIVPFARGGVVNKPTLFPFANGIGLMGEAGPEAIMPLRRTSSGRLGVEATGGTNNIVVNVDASGTQVQGNDTRGKQLGSAISAAVQAELIKQRRPGGLLAS